MKYSYTLAFLEYVTNAFCKCKIEVHKSKYELYIYNKSKTNF